SHAGARVADRAPQARALHDLRLPALGVRLILRPLEISVALPARLGPAEGLPVELDVDALFGVVAFLVGDEVVEAHALRGDPDVQELRVGGHLRLLVSATILRSQAFVPPTARKPWGLQRPRAR